MNTEKTCKPWFWKTSDASTKNDGSSETKTTPSKPNYPFSSSVMNFFDPLYTIKFEIATQENKQEIGGTAQSLAN